MSSDLQGAVGQSVLRREDDYLLRGQGRFVDDLPTPLNTLHLAFVLSPYAHARIASIDASEALALDGVVDVFTGADLAAMVKPIAAQIELPGYSPNARDVLAIDEVRFAGEAVAVVVAESQYLAEDGLELVDVDYEPLPAVVDIHEATEPAAPQVNPTVPGNVYFEGRFATDGVAAAFEAAAHVISEDFHSNRVTAVPIEPRGCLAVPEQPANLVFYSSTQIHHLLRTALAEFLDVGESTLRVIVPDVGGGFGIKAALYPEGFVCAALARRLRRPTKWVQDRYGALLTDVHARDNH